MKLSRSPKHKLSALIVVFLAAAASLVLATGVALADNTGHTSGTSSHDMGNMSGASGHDMQHMTAPTPATASVPAKEPATAHGHGGLEHNETAVAHDMDVAGAPANWYVLAGFAALIGGSTLAAAATKRRLRRKILAGELVGAGVRDA